MSRSSKLGPARAGRSARLADVARAAGVGTSIASRVLNADPTVSIRPETRERILDAARELNYRPNAFARGLKLARTMTLGIIANLSYYYEITTRSPRSSWPPSGRWRLPAT
ncbi:MAG: LacI family DNA-binding transcriptional regulator [Chloroflexi bacterium]|nr:LacI family DNA-binding transcriptional regulator [Chloroflexota bacterium]